MNKAGTVESHTLDEWDKIGEDLWNNGKKDESLEIGTDSFVKFGAYNNLVDRIGKLYEWLDQTTFRRTNYERKEVREKLIELFPEFFEVQKAEDV